MNDNSSPVLLRASTVERGEVWARVVKTRKFATRVVSTVIVAGGMHVLVGYFTFTSWGKRPFPAPGLPDHEGQACAVWPGHQPTNGIALDGEVFVDTFLTALFVSSGQLSAIRDVKKGVTPYIAPDAFPRGDIIGCLFPRGPRVKGLFPPSRHDHCANLTSLFLVALSWCLVWGALSFVLIFIWWMVSGEGRLPGGGHDPVCMDAWTYIVIRAVWTSIQAGLVAGGSFCLWCTRGERADEQTSTLPTAPGFGGRPNGGAANREPFAPRLVYQ
jgi:hypothetical protein